MSLLHTSSRSAKYQEFKEVQQIKAKGARRSNGGGSSASDAGTVGNTSPRLTQHQPGVRQSRTESGTFASSSPRGGVESGGDRGTQQPPTPGSVSTPPWSSPWDATVEEREVQVESVAPKRPGPGRPPGKKQTLGVAKGGNDAAGGGGGVAGGDLSHTGGKMTVVTAGGRSGEGGGKNSGGMGELAAQAQAARRDRRIDTVVIAKCRRKSQTMWPARLCSKREVRAGKCRGRVSPSLLGGEYGVGRFLLVAHFLYWLTRG